MESRFLKRYPASLTESFDSVDREDSDSAPLATLQVPFRLAGHLRTCESNPNMAHELRSYHRPQPAPSDSTTPPLKASSLAGHGGRTPLH